MSASSCGCRAARGGTHLERCLCLSLRHCRSLLRSRPQADITGRGFRSVRRGRPGPLGGAGRRLLRVRERHVVDDDGDSARPQHLGRRGRARGATARAAHARAARGRRPSARPAGRGRSARSATTTPATWTRPAIEAKGLAPLQPTARRIAAIDDRAARSRVVLGGDLRADVDPLNNTPTSTPISLFGLWVAPRLDDPATVRAVPAAGRPRHARPRLLPQQPARHGGRSATKYATHVAAMLRLAGIARSRTGEAGRIVALEAEIARAHATRTRVASTCTKGEQPVAADASSPSARRASTGQRSSTAAGLGDAAAASSSGTRARSRGIAALRRAASRSDAWKDYLDVPRDRSHTPACCRRRSSTSASRSTARCSRGTPKQRPRWKRAVDCDQRRARRGGRPALRRRSYFPPQPKARSCRRWSKNIVAAFGRRIEALDWMTPADQGEGAGQAGHAPGRRRLPRQVARLLALEIVRGDAARERAARRAVRVPAATSREAAASRSTAASGR